MTTYYYNFNLDPIFGGFESTLIERKTRKYGSHLYIRQKVYSELIGERESWVDYFAYTGVMKLKNNRFRRLSYTKKF